MGTIVSITLLFVTFSLLGAENADMSLQIGIVNRDGRTSQSYVLDMSSTSLKIQAVILLNMTQQKLYYRGPSSIHIFNIEPEIHLSIGLLVGFSLILTDIEF